MEIRALNYMRIVESIFVIFENGICSLRHVGIWIGSHLMKGIQFKMIRDNSRIHISSASTSIQWIKYKLIKNSLVLNKRVPLTRDNRIRVQCIVAGRFWAPSPILSHSRFWILGTNGMQYSNPCALSFNWKVYYTKHFIQQIVYPSIFSYQRCQN